MPIGVIVNGANGRVGREMLTGLAGHTDIDLLAGVDSGATSDWLALDNGCSIPMAPDLETVIAGIRPLVVVDFSSAQGAMAAARTCLPLGVNLVIGTTGLNTEDVNEIGELSSSHGVGVVVAANFALGAVVMTHLARIAARYFDYAEITEMHHHLKADSPSGTALATARAMAEARGRAFQMASVEKHTLPGTRGGEVDGIAIHSQRLPGLMAHQEVLLGTAGQTLSIRHDTINRECYVPGVLIAVREVVK
ncbi:MAG: 4-hydroxy-tetrahydrodipicolinate reductase, partial [Dehalococcoidia bacterium]|nr:4-hydroxy-tetrahydrodipicolinate reductase [Dehalococcoidia bacterium]